MPSAIVIGASSGIGQQITIQLCARGFRVGLAARRGEVLAEMCQRLGTEQCVFQAFDLADTKEAVEGFRRLQEQLSPVDYVYLVAGTGFINRELDGLLEETTVAVNCLGFTALAAAALQLFQRQSQGGHLVAITSVAAVRPSGQAPAYGASKTFGSVYLEALRYWVLQNRLPIRLTEVRPGFVDTAMMKASRPFWVISAEKAAALIIAAVDRNKKKVYVPSRWRVIALLMRLLPDRVYAKLG